MFTDPAEPHDVVYARVRGLPAPVDRYLALAKIIDWPAFPVDASASPSYGAEHEGGLKAAGASTSPRRDTYGKPASTLGVRMSLPC